MNRTISSSVGYNLIPSSYTRSDFEGIFDGELKGSTHHGGVLSPVSDEDYALNCITTPLLTSVFLNNSSEKKNPLVSIQKENVMKRNGTPEDGNYSRSKRRRRKISEDQTSSSPSAPLDVVSSKHSISTLYQSKKEIKIIRSKMPVRRCKVSVVQELILF